MKSLVLAALATVLFAAPALAGVACEKVYDTDASLLVCGDPRVFATLVNDSNYPVPFKLVYARGNKAVGGQVVKTFTVPAETTRVRGPIWALGGKAFVVKSLSPEGWETLAKITVARGFPWGTGGCPGSLPRWVVSGS